MSMGLSIGLRLTGNMSGEYTPPDPSAPVNTVAPVVPSDNLGEDDVLTASDGTWTGNPAPTFTYQWFVDGALAVGETNNTYTILSSDAGLDIYCDVTATNSEGAATQASNTVTADASSPPSGIGDRQVYEDLFATDPHGAYHLVHPMYCFQDAAGTTPAGVGDPVALLKHPGGDAAFDMKQTTDSLRPILNQKPNGAYYLTGATGHRLESDPVPTPIATGLLGAATGVAQYVSAATDEIRSEMMFTDGDLLGWRLWAASTTARLVGFLGSDASNRRLFTDEVLTSPHQNSNRSYIIHREDQLSLELYDDNVSILTDGSVRVDEMEGQTNYTFKVDFIKQNVGLSEWYGVFYTVQNLTSQQRADLNDAQNKLMDGTFDWGGASIGDRQVYEDLFATDPYGGYHLVHPDYCFQDAGGTTPSGVGDPVALLKHPGGDATKDMSTTTDANRYVLGQDGNGAYYLSGSGGDLLASPVDASTTGTGLSGAAAGAAMYMPSQGDRFKVRLLTDGEHGVSMDHYGFTGNPQYICYFGSTGAGSRMLTTVGEVPENTNTSLILHGAMEGGADTVTLYADNVLVRTDGQVRSSGLENRSNWNFQLEGETIAVGDMKYYGSFITLQDITTQQRADLDAAQQKLMNGTFDWGGEPAFHPSDLFQNSEQGFALDALDLTTMGSDTLGGGTIVVGDPVNSLADISGNNDLFTQATDGSRPVARADGLEFGPGNTFLTGATTLVLGTGPRTVIMSLRRTGDEGYALPVNLGLHQTAGRWSPSLQADAQQINGRSHNADFATLLDHTQFHTVAFEGPDQGSFQDITCRENGVALTLTSGSATSFNTRDAVAILGNMESGSARANMVLRRMIVIDRLLTAQELADAEAWITEGSGVTLP